MDCALADCSLADLRRINDEIDSQFVLGEKSNRPQPTPQPVPANNEKSKRPQPVLENIPFDDDAYTKCPPMGAKATIRLQKAKIEALSGQLRSLSTSKKDMEMHVEELRSKLSQEAKEKQRLHSALLQAKHAAAKASRSAGSASGSGSSNNIDTVDSLRAELASVKAELSSCQQSMQRAERDQKSRQTQLQRAMEEVNKYKSIHELSKSSTKAKSPNISDKEKSELLRKVSGMEKHRAALLLALKKQGTYIACLKRQRDHAEAASLLCLSQKTFAKERGMCSAIQ